MQTGDTKSGISRFLEEYIMVKINGTLLDIAGTPLADYLGSAGFKISRIAVERNGAIVPRAQYEETILADGDTLEVVSFVGGG